MKTLCYKLVFCYEGLIYNDGFIIIEIGDDEKIKNMEGLLTEEYLGSKITGDRIVISIFSENDKGKLEEFFMVDGDFEEFELPMNIKLRDQENRIVNLRTEHRITDNIENLKERIKQFKENSVFEKERSWPLFFKK